MLDLVAHLLQPDSIRRLFQSASYAIWLQQMSYKVGQFQPSLSFRTGLMRADADECWADFSVSV